MGAFLHLPKRPELPVQPATRGGAELIRHCGAMGCLFGFLYLRLLAYQMQAGQKRGEAQAAEAGKDWSDPTKCDYWAYCAIGGGLCACCGGTSEKCPPGSVAAQIGWVGTCRNPGNGKAYVISYHDCCGQSGCYDCACERNEGAQPRYRPQVTPFVNWCHGGEVPVPYNCTVARVISLAE
jgi:methylamine dehydrogenase light chain